MIAMSPYDEDDLPELRQVDWAALEHASSEEPFNQEAFNLLKDSIATLTTVAGLRTSEQAKGLQRNQAIIVGHYSRMIKLMMSLVRQVADNHGGDHAMSITREFLESISVVTYLLGDAGDGSRYDAYVFDSLIAEREFLKDVRSQIAARGGTQLPIEQRIERSISDVLRAAGLQEDDIPSRRNTGWPNTEARLAPLGPAAYSAYRMGSNAIHGSFADVYKRHLYESEGGFEIDLRADSFKPQPLLVMSLCGLTTVEPYADVWLDDLLPDGLRQRCRNLINTLADVDDLHEQYLQQV